MCESAEQASYQTVPNVLEGCRQRLETTTPKCAFVYLHVRADYGVGKINKMGRWPPFGRHLHPTDIAAGPKTPTLSGLPQNGEKSKTDTLLTNRFQHPTIKHEPTHGDMGVPAEAPSALGALRQPRQKVCGDGDLSAQAMQHAPGDFMSEHGWDAQPRMETGQSHE